MTAICCDGCTKIYCEEKCREEDASTHDCTRHHMLTKITPSHIHHAYNVYKYYDSSNQLEQLNTFVSSVTKHSREELANITVWAMRVASTDSLLDKKIFLKTCFMVLLLGEK